MPQFLKVIYTVLNATAMQPTAIEVYSVSLKKETEIHYWISQNQKDKS